MSQNSEQNSHSATVESANSGIKLHTSSTNEELPLSNNRMVLDTSTTTIENHNLNSSDSNNDSDSLIKRMKYTTTNNDIQEEKVSGIDRFHRGKIPIGFIGTVSQIDPSPFPNRCDIEGLDYRLPLTSFSFQVHSMISGSKTLQDEEKVVQLLKTNKVDINRRDSLGRNALHQAVKCGKPGLVRILLEHIKLTTTIIPKQFTPVKIIYNASNQETAPFDIQVEFMGDTTSTFSIGCYSAPIPTSNFTELATEARISASDYVNSIVDSPFRLAWHEEGNDDEEQNWLWGVRCLDIAILGMEDLLYDTSYSDSTYNGFADIFCQLLEAGADLSQVCSVDGLTPIQRWISLCGIDYFRTHQGPNIRKKIIQGPGVHPQKASQALGLLKSVLEHKFTPVEITPASPCFNTTAARTKHQLLQESYKFQPIHSNYAAFPTANALVEYVLNSSSPGYEERDSVFQRIYDGQVRGLRKPDFSEEFNRVWWMISRSSSLQPPANYFPYLILPTYSEGVYRYCSSLLESTTKLLWLLQQVWTGLGQQNYISEFTVGVASSSRASRFPYVICHDGLQNRWNERYRDRGYDGTVVLFACSSKSLCLEIERDLTRFANLYVGGGKCSVEPEEYTPGNQQPGLSPCMVYLALKLTSVPLYVNLQKFLDQFKPYNQQLMTDWQKLCTLEQTLKDTAAKTKTTALGYLV